MIYEEEFHEQEYQHQEEEEFMSMSSPTLGRGKQLDQ
jgi:hypothetical protein